jgi:hypothetical protein
MTILRSLADLGKAFDLPDPPAYNPEAPARAKKPHRSRRVGWLSTDGAAASKSAPLDGCNCRVCRWLRGDSARSDGRY